MKFSIFTQAILAIPAIATAITAEVDTAEVVKREDCKLTLNWISNWYENAMRRYRVQLVTGPRNDDNLDLYCRQMRALVVELENLQCFWTDNMFVVDISEVQGPAGHSMYKHQHNTAAKGFERVTGCSVIQNT
ncbi:hypothetical protein FLAG1_11222 [Fusarium langsethiae]|uniref:Uncharacterized protein n=1 Tax=Fusarium langsethiae TaxID=179993 RepID=A0A0N0DAZ1_FUSLA|nr:hypothetical protein FLAG1_11222 [Fusarium langsethiae]